MSGTAYQLLPLIALNPRNPDGSIIEIAAQFNVTDRIDRGVEPCGYRRDFGPRTFEVILRDTQSGKQSLLLNRAALIDSFQQSDRECQSGAGPVPCGMRQWLLRDTDTDRNAPSTAPLHWLPSQ